MKKALLILISLLVFSAALTAYAFQEDPAGGMISGSCFSDTNRNHKMDPGEQGIAGITVTLIKSSFLLFREELGTAITDDQGTYAFSGLEPGRYIVKAAAAPAYRSTKLNPRWTVLWGQKLEKDINFGLLRRMQHITISGKAYTQPSMGGSVSPAEGAKITVSTDANGNGRIDLNERASAAADAEGRYSVKAPVAAGMQSTVQFSLNGYAPLFKTIMVNAARDITGFDGTLVQMDDLQDATTGKWRNQAGSVEISSSQISGGSVRLFNPAQEADKFPGSFSDSSGNMLISGVFTSFELEDAAGKRLSTLAAGEPARIRMRMPRDTWGAVVDTDNGTGRIDVPMYYFNEDSGQWVRGKTEQNEDLSGWLERDNGTIIPEAQLASIRSGSFAGEIFAASDVTHFSYWNVDWPVESHACFSGTLLDAQDNPVAGATINVQGTTYTGTSTPQTTDPDGKFCVDVMRSENPGEDVNQNGAEGETQRVLVSGSNGGKLYNFGEFDIPAQPGSCPLNCREEELRATPDKEVQVALCTVNGTATIEGAPTPGVQVYGFDDTIDPEIFMNLCSEQSSCTIGSMTDNTGAFSLTTPVGLKLLLTGYFTESFTEPEATFFYLTQRTVTGCPGASVNLDLELLYCMVNSPAVNVSGGTISMDPNIALTALMVAGKWTVIASSDYGFTGPVTYGSVPADAMQVLPLFNGAPQPLTAGDVIMVVPLGGYVEFQGHQCYSNSMYSVP